MVANNINPYAENCLIDQLRPILSRKEALTALTYLPKRPSNMSDVPRHIRVHYLMMLRDFHVASIEEARLLETTDLILRNTYDQCNPEHSETWAFLAGETTYNKIRPKQSALAALVAGSAGTGKTVAIHNVLSTYDQVIIHPTFPMSAKPMQQVVWLSCDVPASGRAGDLAISLMQAWDMACQDNRFSRSLERGRHNSSVMLGEWSQAASAQFLGLLHLDEIQNFFKSPSLARRRSKKIDEKLELSLVEDTCLKWLLNMTNTKRIALLFSGTPDGVEALSKRMATMQRFTAGGYHHFPHFENADNIFYRKVLLPELVKYQFVAKPLELTTDLAQLILELSGGLMRVIVALWIAAHRIAFERETDDLKFEDFRRAADTYLAPLKPIIAAMRSGDPSRISYHEDLLQPNSHFWASFWTAT